VWGKTIGKKRSQGSFQKKATNRKIIAVFVTIVINGAGYGVFVSPKASIFSFRMGY
jgi:hypothetical protein